MKLFKLTFIILISITILVVAGVVFAQRNLEVPLPGIAGEGEITETPLLPDYIKYIFNFGVGISGVIALFVFIFAGIGYLTSGGNPSKMSDAKDRILSALIGIVVILGSYMILTTINPQLRTLDPELGGKELIIGESPGVYLCRDAAGEDCTIYNKSAVKIGEYDNEVNYIKFVNSEDLGIKYGAVLSEDTYNRGRCAICLTDGCNDTYNTVNSVGGVSSIQVFIQSEISTGEGATLYEINEYNNKCGEECYQTCSGGSQGKICGENCSGFGVGDWWGRPGGYCWGPFKKTRLPELNTLKKVWSLEINESGKWLAALFSENYFRGDCEVFTRNNSNLQDGENISREYINSLIVLPIK